VCLSLDPGINQWSKNYEMMINDHADFPMKVQDNLALLDKLGIPYQIMVFDDPAHRASQAAELLGCELGAVVKSLVFLIDGTDLLLVLVSGENRVDMKQLKGIVGQEITQAKPSDVKKLTGYAVGSVPPFGIPGDFPVVIDEDLMRFETVWTAAGSAHILLCFTPKNLQQLSGGTAMSVKENR